MKTIYPNPRLNFALGAQMLYYGNYIVFAGQFNLNARLVRIETGEIINFESPRDKYNPDTMLDFVGKVSNTLARTSNQKRDFLLVDIYYFRGRTAEDDEDDVDKAIEPYKKSLGHDTGNETSLSAVQRLEGE